MDIRFFNFHSADDADSGFYFRQNVSQEEAPLVLVSVPWGVTSANGLGAAFAPDAIIDASSSVSTFDVVSGKSLQGLVSTLEIDYDIQEMSQQVGPDASKISEHQADGGLLLGEYFTHKIAHINHAFAKMHRSVYNQCKAWCEKGKIIGVVGGDKSVCCGAVRALAELNPGMGLLYIDSVSGLNQKREIFDYSHTSALINLLENVPDLGRVACLGVKDITEEEIEYARSVQNLDMYFMERIVAQQYEGHVWAEQCDKIIETLPEKVYVSLGMGVFSLDVCPHTKNPIAGGLAFSHIVYLINRIVASGKKIIGFDVTDIIPQADSVNDAMSGARMLAKLCCASLKAL